MPSRLNQSFSFDTLPTSSVYPQTSIHPLQRPPQKKQRMTITQTYRVAATARGKLGREAARPDHDLRLLVGHANLLDSLMLELADAERDQEAWFNNTVQKAEKAEGQRHIQWVDTVGQAEEDDDSDSSSDSDSDSDVDFEEFTASLPLKRLRSPPISITTTELLYEDEDDESEDLYHDEEYDEEHALTRTESHPPELIRDDDSDDDTPPPSPPQPTFELSEKQRQAIATTSYYNVKPASLTPEEQESLLHNGFFIPESAPQMIESY